MLLYYIADRTQFPGDEAQRRERLLDKIAEAAHCGVDYIQLREKDLRSRDLEALAREAKERIHTSGAKTQLLINSRADTALAVGADGVHLRSRDVAPDEVRKIWRAAGRPTEPTLAASCHTQAEVAAAEEARVDFVVFGPVFGKKDAPSFGAAGLDTLRTVCRSRVPVFALGGVTLENAVMCADAGAKGMAGIRIFQENDVAAIAAKLRG